MLHKCQNQPSANWSFLPSQTTKKKQHLLKAFYMKPRVQVQSSRIPLLRHFKTRDRFFSNQGRKMQPVRGSRKSTFKERAKHGNRHGFKMEPKARMHSQTNSRIRVL